MNIKKKLIVFMMLAAILTAFLPCVLASAGTGDSIAAKGYMVGNSLTISMSPRRLQALLATQDYEVRLDGQLLGDTSLPEHIGMREKGDPYGFVPWGRRTNIQSTNVVDTIYQVPRGGVSGRSDTDVGFSGLGSQHYFTAMAEEHYDFVTLQPYGTFVNTPKEVEGREYDKTVTVKGKEYYEYQYLGDRQAIGIMIDYATMQKNANDKGADVFLIYEAWTYQDKMGAAGDMLFSEYYNQGYNPNYLGLTDIGANMVVPNKNATELLMSGLREDFAHLGENAIRLVPVSAVLAKLDEMIVDGELPGFQEHMERNADYYIGARNTTNPERQKKDLLENAYVQKWGIRNLFVDSVHMASFSIDYSKDQNPDTSGTYYGYHWGEKDGTLASYITAVTMYSVLTGYSPVGLPVDMGTTNRRAQFAKADPAHDARLDPVADAELIRAVQEAIFEVLCENPYTGIDESAPARTSSSVGHTAGNGQFVKTATVDVVVEASERAAAAAAEVLTENIVWAPETVVAAITEKTVPEEQKTKSKEEI